MKTPILELFGKSPFKPMQHHMEVAYDAAQQLSAFFEASFANDWAKAEETYNSIREAENQADDIKVNVRLQLPKSLFLPVPRQDLLMLLTMQDKVANVSKDIAGLMLGRKMRFPESMQESITRYVDAAVAAAEQAVKAVNELDELLEFGFKGKEISIVEKIVKKLDELENVADEEQVKVRSALFELETELPPVEVIFLYQIIDQIGKLSDRAQQVGSRLLLLVAR